MVWWLAIQASNPGSEVRASDRALKIKFREGEGMKLYFQEDIFKKIAERNLVATTYNDCKDCSKISLRYHVLLGMADLSPTPKSLNSNQSQKHCNYQFMYSVSLYKVGRNLVFSNMARPPR